MENLDQIRLNGVRVIALACVGCAVLTLIGEAWSGIDWVTITLAMLSAIPPVLMALQQQSGLAARLTATLGLISFPMLWLYQWSGSTYGIDIHMTFFAALAMTAIFADWRPVVIAAAATAAHHLLMNFVAPAFVFSEGSDLPRVLLHAVVVMAETGTLVALCLQLEAMVLRQAELEARREEVERQAELERTQTSREQDEVITALGGHLRALAEGNLAERIVRPFPPSYESLRTSFNIAVADLDRSMSRILASIAQIGTSAMEFRLASDDLARRTEEQANAVETNGSLTRALTARIRTTATDAVEASRSITGAQAQAEVGGEVVERAIAAMTEIERSAGEIGQIISIIDGIAFQTSLLALNAGVEAARAGDAGKGFAVVANEVRALAQRSGDAARDIKALISASTEQVGQGVALVGETGTVLRAIVQQVRTIGGAITAIAEASGVQATELATVSQSFAKIDAVAQQNAAMVEENTAAAQNLQHEADTMRQLAERFRTSEQASGAHALAADMLRAA